MPNHAESFLGPSEFDNELVNKFIHTLGLSYEFEDEVLCLLGCDCAFDGDGSGFGFDRKSACVDAFSEVEDGVDFGGEAGISEGAGAAFGELTRVLFEVGLVGGVAADEDGEQEQSSRELHKNSMR